MKVYMMAFSVMSGTSYLQSEESEHRKILKAPQLRNEKE